MNSKFHEVTVHPTGIILNRISSNYDIVYNPELVGIISENDYNKIISKVNAIIQDYWPCTPCIGIGFLCYPCSYLPWFPTNICIGESEKHAAEYLNRVNSWQTYKERNIKFELRKSCCSSGVIISIPVTIWQEKHRNIANNIHSDIENSDNINVEIMSHSYISPSTSNNYDKKST